MLNQHSFICNLFQSFPIPVIRQMHYKTNKKKNYTKRLPKNTINTSINNGYWSHQFFLAKTMKPSCLAVKTALLGRHFQRRAVGKTQTLIVVLPVWTVCRVIRIGFQNWGSLQWRGWFTLCKILCSMDKKAIFLRFSRLIKMSGRNN